MHDLTIRPLIVLNRQSLIIGANFLDLEFKVIGAKNFKIIRITFEKLGETQIFTVNLSLNYGALIILGHYFGNIMVTINALRQELDSVFNPDIIILDELSERSYV